ncbi:hypothetical protein FS837_002082 [Tulasnella sp. UAMH 9824]|nr:hypothetical protein FS837_002082 [Tulasnella sp. UAMH 9824]
MSSVHQALEHGPKDQDITHLTLNAFYGVRKRNLPDSDTGEGTVMKKVEAVMHHESARVTEIPCKPAGKAEDVTTCLLLYEPTEDAPMETVFSKLEAHVTTFYWRIASSLVNAHDKQRVSDAFRQYLSLRADAEYKGYSSRRVAFPQLGAGSSSNEAPLPFPIAECEALAEEEARFCDGMKGNAEQLMDLSTLANRYLQQSEDKPPPIIDKSSPPSQIFSALGFIRRQMKQGMDLIEGFEDLRLQRRELAESLEEQLNRTSTSVEAYYEYMKSQGGATGDETRSSDGEPGPQSSITEERAPLQASSGTTRGSDVEEENSSDESFYRGLKEDLAEGDNT